MALLQSIINNRGDRCIAIILRAQRCPSALHCTTLLFDSKICCDCSLSIARSVEKASRAAPPSIMADPVRVFERQDGLVLNVLSFLDVVTLVQTKQVNKRWRDHCTAAIIAKCPNPKPFETREELKTDVDTYCRNISEEIETLACTRGYVPHQSMENRKNY